MGMKTAREALVQTLKKNKIALVAGVYGDPCTALLDECAKHGLRTEISTEEKTAFAQALGASVAGLPSVVIVKQVGVNVLADPLVTAVTHGIGAGLLLIAGDDPGAAKSQNEQDSRWYAKLADIPVLTPPGPQYVSDAAIEGLSLSATLGIPVMMQVTARLLDGMGRVSEMPLAAEGRFDRDRAWKNLILDRYKYYYQKIYPQLVELVEDSPLHQASPGPYAFASRRLAKMNVKRSLRAACEACAPVAQWEEQGPSKAQVAGSSPAGRARGT